MSQGYTMQGGASVAGMSDMGDAAGGAGGEESIIDRSSAFDGVLRTSRNLRVEGQAKGEIHCEGTLYVDEGADVNATVVAANITVAGALSGEITCRGRLQILPSGRVSGKLATSRLVIQEGAVYEGELRMSNVGGEATAVQVSSGAPGGGQGLGGGMPQNPYRTGALSGRRSLGSSARGDEEPRPDSGPPGEPDRGGDENR